MTGFRRNVLITGAVLSSAFALYLGTGLRPLCWLTWIAVLPLLLIARYVPTWASLGLATIAWFLASLNQWHYFHSVLEIPAVMVLAFLLLPAIIFGVAAVLFRRFLLRGAPWRAALGFAALWVSYEYLLSEFSPHSTFGNLAYTQMDFLPLLQLGSLTGVWGISFLLMFVPAAFAAGLSDKVRARESRSLLAFTTVIFLVVIAWGEWRLNDVHPHSTIKAGLIASDVRANLFPHTDDRGLAVYHLYSEQVDAVAKQGARVIVLPEKIALLSDSAVNGMDQMFAAAAAQNRAYIVAGVDHAFAGAKSLNQARLFSPDGKLLASYDKHHLVPIFEDRDRPGTRRVVVVDPEGKWGLQVCKDMDFPELSREYSRDGSRLLLVPAWDFVEDGWLHSRMAIMRSVEGGFAMVRSAKQGLLTVNDNRGRVLAQQSSSAAPFATLVAILPLEPPGTLYSRFGDWFAWLALAIFVLTICMPTKRSRQLVDTTASRSARAT